MLAVHAVVEDAADDEAIVAGDGVRLVRHDGLAALVSATDDPEPLPTRANLRRHAELVERAHATGATLPLRFGIVADDADALVASFLRPSADALLRRLDAVRGHSEHRLRVTWKVEAASTDVLAGDRGLQRLRRRRDLDGQISLGRGIVDALAARAVTMREHVMGVVRPHVADVVVEHVQDPRTAFVVSFLVRDDADEPFHDAVDRAVADLQHVDAELVGPLPAYSFAEAG